MSFLPWEPAAAVPPLDDDACLVWWAEPGWMRPPLLVLLDAAERDRWERYHRAAERDRFATGVVVSRIVLRDDPVVGTITRNVVVSLLGLR